MNPRNDKTTNHSIARPACIRKNALRLTVAILLPAISALVVAFLMASRVEVSAQAAQKKIITADDLWQVAAPEIAPTSAQLQRAAQTRPRFAQLNQDALEKLLEQAPREFTSAPKDSETILTLPLPDGGLAKFRIEESPLMEPALAEQFPRIKNYRGFGIDDPTATIRFNWTPSGLHAIVLSAQGTFSVKPHAPGKTNSYVSLRAVDEQPEDDAAECLVIEQDVPRLGQHLHSTALRAVQQSPPAANGDKWRIYRLAVAATAEFTDQFRQAGDTDRDAKEKAQDNINTVIQTVAAIFERELAVRLELIDNTGIIFTDADNDGYTNNDKSTMLGENQRKLNNVLGDAGYDIGHVFGGGFTGGVASVGSASVAGIKGRGVTGITVPSRLGQQLIAAHEFGHQFGAHHTFNGSLRHCGNPGQRSRVAAVEPGSGSTIMSYAGNCHDRSVTPPVSQNVQGSKDNYFHAKSLEQMLDHIRGDGDCPAPRTCQPDTNNTPPRVSAGRGYMIPSRTPFTLSAHYALDGDRDTLTHAWEGMDTGPSSPPDNDTDGQVRPLFRSFPPTASDERTFPQLSDILSDTATFGEALPTISRTVADGNPMNFWLTVRDGRGGLAFDAVQIEVDDRSGPFEVTTPNGAVNWQADSRHTIRWDVANTNRAPVNCSRVQILLSVDGGRTFPHSLGYHNNDGSAEVLLPRLTTNDARIKVQASGNIFFDISDADFVITPAPACAVNPITITIGQTINGALRTTDCRTTATNRLRYADRYTFNATAGRAVAISLNSSSFDTLLYLKDPDGRVIAENNDITQEFDNNSRIPRRGFFVLPETGNYTIEATSDPDNATGSYDLTLSAACGEIQIGQGETLFGTLQAGDCSVAYGNGAQYADRYIFNGRAGQRVSVAMTTNRFNGLLSIYDEQGRVLASSGSRPDTTPSIPASGYFTLPATGRYLIQVSAIPPGGPAAIFPVTGSYELTLLAACSTTVINLWSRVEGELSATDCYSPHGRYTHADRYTFEGMAGQRIFITMSSSEFNTFLRLLGPDGQVIASDNNGGAGTDSRLPATGFIALPAAGTYTIEATSVQFNVTGSYTLNLRPYLMLPSATR